MAWPHTAAAPDGAQRRRSASADGEQRIDLVRLLGVDRNPIGPQRPAPQAFVNQLPAFLGLDSQLDRRHRTTAVAAPVTRHDIYVSRIQASRAVIPVTPIRERPDSGAAMVAVEFGIFGCPARSGLRESKLRFNSWTRVRLALLPNYGNSRLEYGRDRFTALGRLLPAPSSPSVLSDSNRV